MHTVELLSLTRNGEILFVSCTVKGFPLSHILGKTSKMRMGINAKRKRNKERKHRQTDRQTNTDLDGEKYRQTICS